MRTKSFRLSKRHRADRSVVDDFADEVLVVCPACGRRATVRLHALEEPVRRGPFRADREARIACTHCGHNARRAVFVRWTHGPVDTVFRHPVWLQARCAGRTLWAYNARHLDALEAYVRAPLRERRRDPSLGWRNAAWVSRIPRWISAAVHRDEVLQCIARLRRERLDGDARGG